MTKGKASFRLTNLPNSTYVFLFAFVLASVLVPNFFTPGNITTMLTQACVMMTLSAAMSMCLMTGCIDLSLGGMVSMTGVVIAILLKNQVHAGLAILAGILSGTVFGLSLIHISEPTRH